jgi:hypothetical protein
VLSLHQKYAKNLLPSKGKGLRHQPIPRKRRVNVRLLVIVISAFLLAGILVYASFKLLPRILPFSRTEESRPSSSSSVPSSAPVPKETEPPTADQPGTNEIHPMDTGPDKDP